MPWVNDGTFERVTNNTTEAGISLWQQDLASNIKVVAYRHDFHDNDMASGITDCLNLDGYNAMRANLDMGTFKITNLGTATLVGDVPAYGQLAGSMTYDILGPGELVLYDRNGDIIDQVTIAPGTGPSGTVTSVGAGTGLVSSTDNPITEDGVLSLAEIGTPGQAYSGGISAIVIDDYGRVTQVTTGGFANTNLGTTYGENFVTITSSTGTNTNISDASSLVAGVMRATDKVKLDGLYNPALTVSQPVSSVSVNAGDGSSAQILPAQPGTGIIGRAGVITNVEKLKLDNLQTSTPAGPTSAGIEGATSYDSGFFYVCVSANSWKRVAIAAW